MNRTMELPEFPEILPRRAVALSCRMAWTPSLSWFSSMETRIAFNALNVNTFMVYHSNGYDILMIRMLTRNS
jgi:hypothetical protein